VRPWAPDPLVCNHHGFRTCSPLRDMMIRNESCNFSRVPESECVAVEWGRAK
jgi:hypothetical protein